MSMKVHSPQYVQNKITHKKRRKSANAHRSEPQNQLHYALYGIDVVIDIVAISWFSINVELECVCIINSIIFIDLITILLIECTISIIWHFIHI